LVPLVYEGASAKKYPPRFLNETARMKVTSLVAGSLGPATFTATKDIATSGVLQFLRSYPEGR